MIPPRSATRMRKEMQGIPLAESQNHSQVLASPYYTLLSQKNPLGPFRPYTLSQGPHLSISGGREVLGAGGLNDAGARPTSHSSKGSEANCQAPRARERGDAHPPLAAGAANFIADFPLPGLGRG